MKTNQKSKNLSSKQSIKKWLCLFCIILCGCITEFIPTGIDGTADILVVEGIITDDVSFIKLSRSVNLTIWDVDSIFSQYVSNAKVFVECDNDTRVEGFFVNNQYVIFTGKLNPERQYRLKIEIDECVPNHTNTIPCNSIMMMEYYSDFSYPIQTPEIDSVFWRKRGNGQPVMIYVATQDQRGKVLYFRWSYKEYWEYFSDVYLDGYPYYCWNSSYNPDLLLGNTEKTVFGKLNDIVTEINPWSQKLSYLYRIEVSQNVISKRAYDYFENIQMNAQQTGSIFAPIPSELRGNISCSTDPKKPVIGYVDVSSTTKSQRFIYYHEGSYERPGYNWECQIFTADSLYKWYGGIPPDYILYDDRARPPTYVKDKCVDCTLHGGRPDKKPEDWPINH